MAAEADKSAKLNVNEKCKKLLRKLQRTLLRFISELELEISCDISIRGESEDHRVWDGLAVALKLLPKADTTHWGYQLLHKRISTLNGLFTLHGNRTERGERN